MRRNAGLLRRSQEHKTQVAEIRKARIRKDYIKGSLGAADIRDKMRRDDEDPVRAIPPGGLELRVGETGVDSN